MPSSLRIYLTIAVIVFGVLAMVWNKAHTADVVIKICLWAMFVVGMLLLLGKFV